VFRTSWVHPQADSCICSAVCVARIGVSSLVDRRVSISQCTVRERKKDVITFTNNHHYHYYHLANMQLAHLFTRFGLTRLEFFFTVFPGFFCPLVCSFFNILGNISWGVLFLCCNQILIYSCILPKNELYLVLFQSLCLYSAVFLPCIASVLLLFFSESPITFPQKEN
jgi:hypothetical protein